MLKRMKANLSKSISKTCFEIKCQPNVKLWGEAIPFFNLSVVFQPFSSPSTFQCVNI